MRHRVFLKEKPGRTGEKSCLVARMPILGRYGFPIFLRLTGGVALSMADFKHTASLPKERDAAVECWLREEVAQTYDAMEADPVRAIPAEVLQGNLRNHHLDKILPNQ